MTQTQSAEEKARLKKQWTDLAIQQALASQWEEAVSKDEYIPHVIKPGDLVNVHIERATAWSLQGCMVAL